MILWSNGALSQGQYPKTFERLSETLTESYCPIVCEQMTKVKGNTCIKRPNKNNKNIPRDSRDTKADP